jgi:hypothetical protein
VVGSSGPALSDLRTALSGGVGDRRDSEPNEIDPGRWVLTCLDVSIGCVCNGGNVGIR